MSLLDAKQSMPLEGGASFALSHRLLRGLWIIAWAVLASWTPPQLHRWRAWLLGRFGADMHPTARVYSSARIWYPPNLTMHAHAVFGPRVNCYCMDRITICEKAVVSQGVHLCGGSHNISDPNFQLVTGPIVIGALAWVAAEAFVGPGVIVGEGAVVGARAVLFGDAEPYSVYLGNPALLVKRRVISGNS